jgi:hypothetical protein
VLWLAGPRAGHGRAFVIGFILIVKLARHAGEPGAGQGSTVIPVIRLARHAGGAGAMGAVYNASRRSGGGGRRGAVHDAHADRSGRLDSPGVGACAGREDGGMDARGGPPGQ